MFMLQLCLPVFLIVTALTIALSKSSLSSLFSLLTTFALMWFQVSSFWKHSFVAIGVLSQMEAVVCYLTEYILMITESLDQSESNMLLQAMSKE